MLTKQKGLPTRSVRWLLTGGAMLLAALPCGARAMQAQQGLPDAPSASMAQVVAAKAVVAQQPVSQSSASLSGAVKDIGGTPVGEATVSLVGPAGLTRSAITDDEGEYLFDVLPAGEFTLTAVAEGLSSGSETLTVGANEQKVAADFALRVATAIFQVDAISQTELAEIQIKQEEKQRMLGIMPNFYIVYDHNAVPLTARQKYKLAWRSIIDPVNFGIVGITAGVQQAEGTFAGYGSGPGGYGKRFGANYANLAIGTVLAGAVFPQVFRQDPRYFYKGTGSVWSRAAYAFSTSVRAKGDNGKWQVGYANLLGDFSAGAISNIYYPASDRDGVKLTLENGALAVLSDGIGNVVQELILNHLTTKKPKQTTP